MLTTTADLTRQRNALTRALYALTSADERLEQCADLCAQFDWDDVAVSLKLVRSVYFGPEFEDLPLCALELDAAIGDRNSVAVILGYGVWQAAIRRQLHDLQQAARGRAPTAASA